MGYLSFRKNVFGIICLIVTAAIVIAGLWPFNFWPENKVKWLPNQNGVQFSGQAIIYSTIPSFQSSNIPMEPLSLEICLQPEKELYDYTACILYLNAGQASGNLFIGQWKTHLIIEKRINIIAHGERYRKIGLRNLFHKGVKRFLTITSGPEETKIYIDGNLAEKYPKFNLFSRDDRGIERLILGNAPTGKQSWAGNLFHLAFYNRTLTAAQVLQHFQSWEKKEESLSLRNDGLVAFYSFDEHSGTLVHDRVGGHHLVIPARFEILQKTILIPPWEDFRFSRSYLIDILTNVLGFIPFGFFLSAYLWIKKPRSIFRLLLMSIITAGCISLSIELIQVYLPTRSSQLADVMMNILGTAIGVALFFKSPVNRWA